MKNTILQLFYWNLLTNMNLDIKLWKSKKNIVFIPDYYEINWEGRIMGKLLQRNGLFNGNKPANIMLSHFFRKHNYKSERCCSSPLAWPGSKENE